MEWIDQEPVYVLRDPDGIDVGTLEIRVDGNLIGRGLGPRGTLKYQVTTISAPMIGGGPYHLMITYVDGLGNTEFAGTYLNLPWKRA